MILRGAFPCILAAALLAATAAAETAAPPPPGREVFFNRGELVLVEDQKVTRFITPKALAEHGRFQIRLVKPPAPATAAAAEPPPAVRTLADRIEARRIMNEANQAFFAGEITRTWDLVAKAESLDPTYYRIKTMKGSLLFKIGSPDLAAEVWRESLAQNPDQPEIVTMLQRLGESAQGSQIKGLAKSPAEPEATAR